MRASIAVLAILAVVAVCHGRTITVDDDGPADFSTIQAAIDDSNDGDTVLVADGIYTGDGNRDIDFHGKAITVISENGPETCIIDCNGTRADRHRGFKFHNGETYSSVLSGLTITNGWAFNGEGGGIYCIQNSSPTISNCRITANWALNGGGICCNQGSSPTIKKCIIRENSGGGGGMYLLDSDPRIVDCVISNNIAPLFPGFPGSLATNGGGIDTSLSSPLILNCIISENTATGGGGGLYCFKGDPIIKNCTIGANTADSLAGAVLCYADCTLTISNSIVWGNSAPHGRQISLQRSDLLGGCPTVGISYTDHEGGLAAIHRDRCHSSYVIWGAGNIDADPCFADPGNGDYHLKSQGGRWDPNELRWTTDEVTSACIDAGNPASPISFEPFPNGGVINMGAYGGTIGASKSYFDTAPCETIAAGDINGDCRVDFSDFAILASHWLEWAGRGLAVTNVKVFRCELIEGRFIEQEQVQKVTVGEAFTILVEVTNFGSAMIETDCFYHWELSPENLVELIGEPLPCATWHRLQPGDSTWITPFCPGHAFEAEQAGWVTMDIWIDYHFDMPPADYTFLFEIL